MDDCSNCRFHSVQTRAKPVAEAFDTLVELEDEPQAVYICRAKDGPHTGKELVTPVHCSAYIPGKPGLTADTEALLQRWKARGLR